MSSFVEQLESVLRQTTQPDTAVVTAASKKLSKEFYPEQQSLSAMLQLVCSHPEAQMRQLAAIEGRKLVDRHWEKAADDEKKVMRDQVLKSTLEEASDSVAHSCAQVINSIVMNDKPSAWPDLMEHLVNAVNSEGNPHTKEVGIYVLYILMDQLPLNDQLLAHREDIFMLFAAQLEDFHINNRVYALLGVIAIAASDGEITPEFTAKFQQTISKLVDILLYVVQKNDEHMKSVFTAFHEFQIMDTKLIGDSIFQLIKVFIDLASDHSVDDEARCMALQFLIRTAAIKKTKLIAQNLGSDLALAALRIGCDPVDEDEELDDDDEQENEENTTSELGFSLLGTLASEFPASQVVAPIVNAIPELVASQGEEGVWRARAGFLALKAVLPGAPDYIGNSLGRYVSLLVEGLKNPSTIVRLAALKTVHDMTMDLQNQFASYHSAFLPVLMMDIQEARHQIVYKYATLCVDGIIEYMEQEAIIPYLGELTNRLAEMLQQASSSALKTAIISAIGSTAFAAGTHFIPHFETALHLFEPLMKIPDDYNNAPVDDVELAASTMENLSIIARAVGPEPFAKYAEALIDASYACISTDNSRLKECAFMLITNLTKVYTEDFAPMLPKLIPEIIKCLEQEDIMFYNEGGEFDEADVENLDDFVIRTGVALEKEIAALALSQLATATKQHFSPYVEEVINCLMGQEDTINFASVYLKTLWDVCVALYENNCETKFPTGAVAGSYIPEELLKIIKSIRTITIESLKEEFEIYNVKTILIAIEESLSKMGPIAIMDNGDSSSLEQLCIELMKILKNEHISQTIDDEDVEERGVDADESENELMVYDIAVDVLVSLSKVLGSDFNRIFSSFKSVMFKAMSSVSKQKRSTTMGALGEICEGLKSSNQFEEELLEVFVTCLEKDSSLNVKSLAAYSIGVVVFNSPKNLTSAYPRILESLSKLLAKTDKAPKVDEEDDETANIISRSYANACGCVARLALKSSADVPLQQIVPVLLEHLPLTVAFEENTPIFNLLIELYQNHLDLIQPYNAKVLEIFKHAFKADEDRIRLEKESTIGREQNLDTLKQFPAEGLKEKVTELVNFISK